MRISRWGSVALLVCLVLGNLIAKLTEDQTKFWLEGDLFVWHHKTKRLSVGDVRAETIVLGDSQAMSGILPAALDESVYNLGLPSQQPAGLYALSESLIQDPMIQTFVVNVSPFTVFKSEVNQSFLTYYRSTVPPGISEISNYPDLLREKGVGDLVYRALRVLPMFSLHDRLAPVIAHKDGMAFVRERMAINEKVEQTLVDHSGFWSWKASTATCEQEQTPAPVHGIIGYAENPKAVALLVRTLKRLKSGGKRVVVVSIPFSEQWSSLASVGTDARFSNVLKQIQNQSGVEVFPEVRREDYTGLFQDWTHLNLCGAKKYTSWLAARLLKDHQNNTLEVLEAWRSDRSDADSIENIHPSGLSEIQ